MKRNQRTIKVYDTTHAIASRLSVKFGVSMAALVDLLVHEAEKLTELRLPARDKRVKKANSRSVVPDARRKVVRA